MKHLFTLKTIMLACLLFVGMGAWAESTVTTYTFNSKSWGATCNGSNANWTGSKDGNQYSASNSPIGVQILAAGDGTTVTSPKSFTNVSKVVVNYSSSGKGVGSIKVSVGGTDIDTKSISKSQSKVDLTYTPATNLSGNVVITCNCTTNSYALVSVSITEESGGGDTPTVTAPTFSVAAGTYAEDKNVTISNYNRDYLYAYTIDGTNPAFDAELNVTNGTAYDNNSGITITSSCTLKAIAVDEEGNASSITSAAYTINKPQVFASLGELVAADLTSGTNVTVSFENVPIKSFQTVSSTRKGVYFDIQKGGNDIEIYFNSAVPAGWVEGGTLSGTLTNCPWNLYNGTWELAPVSGWAWANLTYNAPAFNIAPVITTQPISATYELNESASNLTVAASGNPAPTYQWYSNTTNSNENGTVLTGETNVSYKPSTATAGTFYYYCVATNSEGSATSSVATITVNEPVRASLPFSFDGGVSDIASKDGMSQTGIGSDYASSPKLKFDSQGDNVIINFNEAAKKVTYTIKGNSMSGTHAFDVLESADGVNYTTVHSHTTIVGTSTEFTDNLFSASRFLKFVYTKKDGGNVGLGKISIVEASALEDPDLAFGQSTYTFYVGDDMQVVATSSAGSAGAITYELTAGDENAFLIDDNTGDILCETAGTYTVTANIAVATGFNSGTATCTVKILEPIVGNSIIVAETDGRCYAMTTTCEGSYFGNKSIKKVGDKYVVNSLDDILFYTSTADGKTIIQSTSNNQYVQATAAKTISYTEDEYKWTNDGEKLTAANASYGTLQYNTGSPRFTTYTSKVGQYATIVDLANVIVGDVVSLNAACTDGDFVYGTYSNGSNWVVPEGLTVSEVCVVDGELAVYSYNEGNVVPANAGVMVAAEKDGNYIVNLTNNAATASPSGDENSLVGTGNGITAAEMAQADTEFFRLTMHNGKTIGFFWGAEDGDAFDLGANKAYLAVGTDKLGLAKGARLWINNSANGIKTVNAEATVNKAVKRIMNGQLVIEKAGKMYNAAGAEMK